MGRPPRVSQERGKRDLWNYLGTQIAFLSPVDGMTETIRKVCDQSKLVLTTGQQGCMLRPPSRTQHSGV